MKFFYNNLNKTLPSLNFRYIAKEINIIFILANFTLPEEDADTLVPIFVETSYVELDKEKAKEVVDLYNKIAKEKGFGKKHEERKNKKFRGHNRGNARARGSGSFAP